MPEENVAVAASDKSGAASECQESVGSNEYLSKRFKTKAAKFKRSNGVTGTKWPSRERLYSHPHKRPTKREIGNANGGGLYDALSDPLSFKLGAN